VDTERSQKKGTRAAANSANERIDAFLARRAAEDAQRSPEEKAEIEALIKAEDARRKEQLRWMRHHSCLSDLGQRYSPARCSLDNYQITHPERGQRRVLDEIRALAARLPESVAAGENLILAGPCGVGKDHLIAALLHLAGGTHQMECRYTTGSRLYAQLRSTMQRSGETEDRVIHEFVSPKILAMSDPVLEGTDQTDWQMSELFAIVDGRYSAMRPTWISVNASDEKGLEELLPAQVYDRLRDNATILYMKWPSFRGR
jgi:DNA replication protein DnaC